MLCSDWLPAVLRHKDIALEFLAFVRYERAGISKSSDFEWTTLLNIYISISSLSLLFRCHAYPNSIGFPTARKNEKNNYVAAIVSNEDKLWEKCPTKCRREGHENDWEYC